MIDLSRPCISRLPLGQRGPLVVFSLGESLDKVLWFPIFSSTQLNFIYSCLIQLSLALKDSKWLWDFERGRGVGSKSEYFLECMRQTVTEQLQEEGYNSLLMLILDNKLQVIPLRHPEEFALEYVHQYIPPEWISSVGTLMVELWGVEDFYEDIKRLIKEESV